MFDRAYRQRLEADIAQWEADGVITPAAVTAIRVALPPLAPGFNIATVVAIVGGLLIAAAFLAFVAAHWTGNSTPAAPGYFACRHRQRPRPRRLVRPCGQAGPCRSLRKRRLDHLWCRNCPGRPDVSSGRGFCGRHAVVGSGRARRGSVDRLARCARGCAGSRNHMELHARQRTNDVPHFSFVVVWIIAAGLTLAWNSRVAAHLVALAVLPWWIVAAVHPDIKFAFRSRRWCSVAVRRRDSRLPRRRGGGLLPPVRYCRPMGLLRWPAPPIWRWQRLMTFRTVLTLRASRSGRSRAASRERSSLLRPLRRRAGQARPLPLVLSRFSSLQRRYGRRRKTGEPWLAYALVLCAMLCLVVSGMLDDCPLADRRRLARDCRRHCGNHMGGKGLAAAPLGVPRGGRRCRGRACNGAQSPTAENRRMTGTFAASLAERWKRIPKVALFGAAVLIQVALLAAMIVDRVPDPARWHGSNAADPSRRSARFPARRLCRPRLRHIAIAGRSAPEPARQHAQPHGVRQAHAQSRRPLCGGLGACRGRRGRKPRGADPRPGRVRCHLRHKRTHSSAKSCGFATTSKAISFPKVKA